jgi:hypothetical protein
MSHNIYTRKMPGPNDWSVTETTDIDNQLSNIQNTKRLDRMERMLEKICERLAILEEPVPERLEEFKQLQDAYNKYKFLDELCGPHDDGSKD